MSEIKVLPFTDVSLDLADRDFPNVSIIIPCYQRREFIPLIIVNLLCQDYPHDKLEVVILQDGPDDLFLTSDHRNVFEEAIFPVKLKYKFEEGIRRSIGEKRNRLVKMCSNNIIASMDSDDIYLESYLRFSVNALKEHGAGATSSNAMIFIYPKINMKSTAIHCPTIDLCHEACTVFTKKYWKSVGGFDKSSQGEGLGFFSKNSKKVLNLDVSKLMVCVCHGANTIDKNQFETATEWGGINENSTHIKLLRDLFPEEIVLD